MNVDVGVGVGTLVAMLGHFQLLRPQSLLSWVGWGR